MRRGNSLNSRPLTPAGRRLGAAAAGLALFNWTVLGLGLAVSAISPAVPGLQRLLLGAGALGWVLWVLVIASAFFVWLVAWYLVGRDPGLSARAWSRWTLALVVMNLIAGHVYVTRWWLRSRRQGA